MLRPTWDSPARSTVGACGPAPGEEPDEGKAQNGPEGRQAGRGGSSGHVGRPGCRGQQITAPPGSGSAVMLKLGKRLARSPCATHADRVETQPERERLTPG